MSDNESIENGTEVEEDEGVEETKGNDEENEEPAEILVDELVDENPELNKYDIKNNKGYGTKKHLEAIKEYGITKWHRKSFGICKNYNV